MAQDTIENFYSLCSHKSEAYTQRFFTAEASVLLPDHYSGLSVPVCEWVSIFQTTHSYLSDYQCIVLSSFFESASKNSCIFKVNVLHQHGDRGEWQCVDRISLAKEGDSWKVSAIELDVVREGVDI